MQCWFLSFNLAGLYVSELHMGYEACHNGGLWINLEHLGMFAGH